MLHSITVRIILILLLHFTVWYYPTGRFTQGTFTQMMIKEISCFSQWSVHSFSYKDNDTGWISAIATNLNWFVSDKVLQILIRGHSEMGFDGRTIIFFCFSPTLRWWICSIPDILVPPAKKNQFLDESTKMPQNDGQFWTNLL